MRIDRGGARRVGGVAAAVAAVAWLCAPAARVQEDASGEGRRLYDAVRAFALEGGAVDVEEFALVRDRLEMRFTGRFYLAGPVAGRVTGAVFIGQGTFRAAPPASEFERDNVRRLIGADAVESDFRTAVLRWTDDTFAKIAAHQVDAGATVPAQAERLAAESEQRFTRETGANLAARLAGSILNRESPGVFAAHFDGGRRGRFHALLDPQNRIPLANFRINGGEKGLVFAYQTAIHAHDVWLAFYSLEDYERRSAVYSDANDLIDVRHYAMDLDVRELTRRMTIGVRMEATAKTGGLRAIPLTISEDLGTYANGRLDHQMKVRGARVDGRPAAWAQEEWEGGFTVFLPAAAAPGQALAIELDLEGDFLESVERIPGCYYPVSNTSWYPRHGYLDRATYDLRFRHRRLDRVASVGVRTGEQPDPADATAMITTHRMAEPVALVVFALGPFERHGQPVTWDIGGAPVPLEFHSVPNRIFPVKADFIVAELDNSVRYFAAMFGRYPYPAFGAAFHPYPFGQGFPTLLMIPPTDRAEKYTYAFIAHETAHQWWGNIVAWRSYRDQWLSEGFAEYSGVLYTGLRDSARSAGELIRELRDSLKDPPRTAVGLGRGRLNDIGPIVLGHRLHSSKSYGAYQALVYNKGALVLRMLHFLMSHPVSGDDKPFVAMMTDFVERHRNGSASTDDFRAVAGAHFAKTPIAQRYGLRDLDWFFSQWVYQSGLPSFHLEYSSAQQADGSFLVSGTVRQEGVPEGWFMPLPIVMSFDGNQQARTTVAARGPSAPFEIKAPLKPRRVELDPASWVLSERTTARAR